MVNSAGTSLLGQKTEYIEHYAPELLFPIARKLARQSLALPETLPFYGGDVWTGYEVSWLDQQGKPQVAIAEFTFPCTSEFIIESKSFKLYLNSLNQTRYDNIEQLVDVLVQDLSGAVGAKVEVVLQSLNNFSAKGVNSIDGELIDGLPVVVEHYHPTPELLAVTETRVDETLYSDLLKTNCPVTGQPDWASVEIRYRGAKITRESLLLYIISFRQHQDFHEHCVERMFMDILTRCRPESLSVYARYTRRGGLDINPYRTTEKNQPIPSMRLVRQ